MAGKLVSGFVTLVAVGITLVLLGLLPAPFVAFFCVPLGWLVGDHSRVLPPLLIAGGVALVIVAAWRHCRG